MATGVGAGGLNQGGGFECKHFGGGGAKFECKHFEGLPLIIAAPLKTITLSYFWVHFGSKIFCILFSVVA